MSKPKFKFNPSKLSYEEVVLTKRQKAAKFTKNFLYVSVVATIFLLILSIFFDTPGESRQKRENKQLLAQYEKLNNKLDRMENTMSQIKDRDDNIYRLIFGTEPVPESYRNAGFGGINRYKELEKMSDSEVVIETSKKIDQLHWQMKVQWSSYKDIIALAKEKETFLKSIPAISPIADKDLTRFASGYGYRIHPIYHTKKLHTGIDLTANTGTDIYATGGGKVLRAGYAPGGYGKKVLIDHGFGYKTLYAHMHSVDVVVGQTVKRGEKIGEVGNTGRSTAPHLHYEVRKNNKFENPINYYFNDLSPKQYEEVIKASTHMNMSFD